MSDAEANSAFDFVATETLIALDMLHDAIAHVRKGFSMRMTPAEAQANLDARALLFNCSNLIFKEHGCPISREEVEGAAIIEKELGM